MSDEPIHHAYTCGAAGHAGAARHAAPVIIGGDGKRAVVVDIHCHLMAMSAFAITREKLIAADEPSARFITAASRAVNEAQQSSLLPKLTDLKVRLEDMDRAGIDIQVLSPAPPQYCYWAEADLAQENARLINDHLAEAVRTEPGRFAALGTVPMQEPELAVAELRRAVRDLGLRGVEIGTNIGGLDLGDPKFRPFFAAAEELGALVFLHPNGFTHGERLTDFYLNNVVGNPLESTIALSHLIFGGVLERYSGLKLCVAHGGGYLASYFGRMDHAYRVRPECRAEIGKPPSAYLKTVYFDNLVFSPDQLEFLVSAHGAEHILLGTDYPYDMSEADPVGLIARTRLSPRQKRLVAGENAIRALGLTCDAQTRRLQGQGT